MNTKRLPIAGYTHLALAATDNALLHTKTVALLRKAGFTITSEYVIPPDGADSRTIIAAITAAFQAAKAASP